MIGAYLVISLFNYILRCIKHAIASEGENDIQRQLNLDLSVTGSA